MNKEQSWFKHYWRPALAWQYVIVCLFDFMIAPLTMMLLPYLTKTAYIPWEPLTLKESAFYHIAMMPILGVSAWTRGQEKINKILTGDTKTDTPEEK